METEMESANDAEKQAAPKLVEVYMSQGHLRANAAKAKLEAAGIPALLSYDSASLIFGLTVDGIGQVRVLVPESYATEAHTILAEDQTLTSEEEESLLTEDQSSPSQEVEGSD